MNTLQRGFSFIEIMVVVAIVLALAAVTVVSLTAMKDRMLLKEAQSTIAFHLEESKARSVAGRGGEPHGVNFGDGQYTQFEGDEYDADSPLNVLHDLDPRLTVTTDIMDSEKSVVFSRITGRTEEEVRITISLSDDERTVVVGVGGDISYE